MVVLGGLKFIMIEVPLYLHCFITFSQAWKLKFPIREVPLHLLFLIIFFESWRFGAYLGRQPLANGSKNARKRPSPLRLNLRQSCLPLLPHPCARVCVCVFVGVCVCVCVCACVCVFVCVRERCSESELVFPELIF